MGRGVSRADVAIGWRVDSRPGRADAYLSGRRYEREQTAAGDATTPIRVVLRDENPGRVKVFGIVLVIFGLLALPFFIIDLSATNGTAVLAALRMLSCLLGGAYLLLRVHLSRREPDR